MFAMHVHICRITSACNDLIYLYVYMRNIFFKKNRPFPAHTEEHAKNCCRIPFLFIYLVSSQILDPAPQRGRGSEGDAGQTAVQGGGGQLEGGGGRRGGGGDGGGAGELSRRQKSN